MLRDYEKISDQELLRAIAEERDEGAFVEFTRRYRDPITNYIYRMLNDYDRAVDLAQETFFQLWINVEQLLAEARGNFSTLIYQIAYNLTVEELRRRKRRNG
jgi:RNA polymerase sigma-70 factor (ECF subfamily)